MELGHRGPAFHGGAAIQDEINNEITRLGGVNWALPCDADNNQRTGPQPAGLGSRAGIYRVLVMIMTGTSA